MGRGFSVVIPCFNAERYICRCLDSIKATGYENLEIIVVDDCSTDDTLVAIENWREKNILNLVLVQNESNIGAGMTRNEGIKLASKELITFVDADDVIVKCFFERIDCAFNKEECDCIIFDALAKNAECSKRIKMFIGGGLIEGRVSQEKAIVYIRGGTWGKAYKTKIIKDNKVSFANLKRNEDMPFTKVALSYCENIYYVDRPLYIYMDNPNSLMHNAELLDKNNALKGFEIVRNNVNKEVVHEDELNALYLYEVVYTTTMTELRQNDSYASVRKWYIETVSGYKKEPYSSCYELKYRILLFMFRMNLFVIVKLFV